MSELFERNENEINNEEIIELDSKDAVKPGDLEVALLSEDELEDVSGGRLGRLHLCSIYCQQCNAVISRVLIKDANEEINLHIKRTGHTNVRIR